ncbi:hypothetical protein [Halalkaliarchaeum desulfuricum]|nr:hypothetical protein [Halalkaliarchaeum desulfuricum]
MSGRSVPGDKCIPIDDPVGDRLLRETQGPPRAESYTGLPNGLRVWIA